MEATAETGTLQDTHDVGQDLEATGGGFRRQTSENEARLLRCAQVDFLVLTIPPLSVQVTKYMVKVGDDLRQAVSLSPTLFAGWL